jgi:poly(hydroxyalkanoate) granule-associated protein
MRTTTTMTEQAKKFQTEVRENAHKAWLAGLGTVSLVDDERRTLVEDGRKLFDDLVKRGRQMETRGKKEVDKATKEAKKEVEGVRGRVEKRFDQLTGEVDKRVVTTLHRLGIPTREEIRTLTARVEELTARLEGQMKKLEKAAVQRVVYHVATHEDGWKVEREGTTKPLTTHGTKDEALDAARTAAQTTTPSQVVVHRMDGTIQTHYTYDPADA